MSIFAIFTFALLLCLTFSYTNGFQDGSSVAATAIRSRGLSAIQTALLVCTFEFLGALLGGSAVANSIFAIIQGKLRADLLPILCSGLVSAVLWNYFTKVLRLPSSSTHALVGGILGAVFAGGGNHYHIPWGAVNHVLDATGVARVVLSLFVSPLLGFIAGWFIFHLLCTLLLFTSTRVNFFLKKLQWFTTAALAFGHGANDAQKSMGVITLGLCAVGYSDHLIVPLWVRILAGLAIAYGVIAMVPGIVKRVGSGIYNLRPVHGISTQIASSAVLIFGSLTGGPVSATQVISSTVMGVGFADRQRGVHWLVAKDMIIAWFLTIPCAAILAWLIYVVAFHDLLSLVKVS